MKKFECELCGKTFNEDEFIVENTNGEITIECSSGCNIGTIYIPDFCADIKEIS